MNEESIENQANYDIIWSNAIEAGYDYDSVELHYE